MLDFELIQKTYAHIPSKLAQVRKALNRPLTFTEKILSIHLNRHPSELVRGQYSYFSPDRVALQDATAQMALLQFMNAGKDKVAVPTTIHCDHLIQAEQGAEADLKRANIESAEIFDFLKTVGQKYGIGFWGPGAGIIHQVLLENYAFPGGMMIGTDSHTVNGGGLGMLSIGVGGADAVDVMTGMDWELKIPQIIGVKLTGKLTGWASAKDVILKLSGILTVKGGTNAVIEYFGEGTRSLSCTGKATICNMAAEVGATGSIFPFDDKMAAFLAISDRPEVANAAKDIAAHLSADEEVYQNPEAYYDRVIEIDLSTLEPHINGPFTPDAAWPISKFKAAVTQHNYPEQASAVLVGSCTNSSYEDMTGVASVIRQATSAGLNLNTEFIVTPGSENIKKLCEAQGILKTLEDKGATVMANACGPCIGQWKRHHNKEKNSIVTSFNRNFARRNDGNPLTHAFVTSPELATAIAISGKINFNPNTDNLLNDNGESIKLLPPDREELPKHIFGKEKYGFIEPQNNPHIQITVDPNSDRLQLLEPFPKMDPQNYNSLKLLIKTKGKCTTDHISMAGPWLKYRGHLDNISNNLLMGAENAFHKENGFTKSPAGHYESVAKVARTLKANGQYSVIVAEENYGEGSSREHAAMEPRHLGVEVVIAKSFARIHETNLKKQGILALTFHNKSDYDKIQEEDTFKVLNIENFQPNKPIEISILHKDQSIEHITLNHTYSENQIHWFKVGGALNVIRNYIKEH